VSRTVANPDGGAMHRVILASRKTRHGVTLMEIVAAALIGALIAGGALMAFVMAAKVSRSSSDTIEAASFAQQTLERFRNNIACDGTWFDSTTCTSGGGLPTALTFDPDDPASNGLPAGAPLLKFSGTRRYQVTEADCDGVGGVGDCFKVMVKVQWTPPQ